MILPRLFHSVVRPMALYNSENLAQFTYHPIALYNSENLAQFTYHPIALYNSENLAQFTYLQIRAIEENKIDYLTKCETNLKVNLGVKRNCSTIATLGELGGEFPLHLHGLISLLSYWHRLTLMAENTLAKQNRKLPLFKHLF